MTDADPLETLRDRIDLQRVPFTDRLLRLLVLREADRHALWIGQAAYEQPAAACAVLRRLRFTANGSDLPADISARPDRIEARTPAGEFAIAFVDPETLLITVPAANTGIAFELAGQPGDAAGGSDSVRTGGAAPCWLAWAGAAQTSMSSSAFNLAPVQDDATTGDPAAIVLRVTEEPGGAPPVPNPRQTLAAAERRWRDWFARAPEVPDALRPMTFYAWWVLRANQILPRFDPRRAGVAPSKIGYVGVWNWDACFHALGLRHGDVDGAKDQLRIILAHQLPDGMLPDVVHDAGVLASTLDLPPAEREFGLPAGWDPAVPIPLTKPPLLAWAARKIWEIDGDTAFLREVYEPIAVALNWWFRTADADGDGLYAYDHPFSSGLDDSPLWDGGPPVTAPELNAYLVLQCDEMAEIAAHIGRHQDIPRWRRLADAIAGRLVSDLWEDRLGQFASTRHGARIPVATPFGLMPLLTARLPDAISRRLVATLHDPQRFWPRFPVPTVALDDPAFNPDRMWRGPVWLNVNRLLVEGLTRSGYEAEAIALRRRTLEGALACPDFREYYNPLSGMPPERAAPMFSWAAAAFLDLAAAEALVSGS
jgi:hypothetical protein